MPTSVLEGITEGKRGKTLAVSELETELERGHFSKCLQHGFSSQKTATTLNHASRNSV
ncbi:MAG: hypothetical protein ACREBW_10000 [Candidatus Micrarchaeaceae archaeon]